MPDLTLTLVPWPTGTNVALYPRVSELHMDDMPPPQVVPVTTQAVLDDGSLTYVGVPEGSYWAIAPIDGVYRYVAAFAQSNPFVPV